MIQRNYSPTMRGFYSDDAHSPEERPKDCTPIGDETWQALLTANSEGKEIVYDESAAKDLRVFVRAPVVTMDVIRITRNKKLRLSDWTQGRDVPEELSLLWSVYRQELRDLPQVYEGRPQAVVWPQPPLNSAAT